MIASSSLLEIHGLEGGLEVESLSGVLLLFVGALFALTMEEIEVLE